MEAIRGFYENYIRWSAASMTLSDVLEIAIFTYFIYHIILWIKQSKAWILLKGAAAIFAMYILAVILQLNNIVMVFNRIAPYVATALLVIFQPEIRRALEQLGTNHLFELFSLSSTKDKVAENADDTIDAIVRASFSMGRAKSGALIVIEQKFVLNEYIATGILLDAIVSAPLLVQIFEHNLPLHDGAVVIRGNRITAATCYLPLSENKTISKELGTRHRAGLGISEVTDALTVIVSEETGQVSLTKDGQLYRNVNSDKLRELLGGTKSSEKTQTVWDRLRKGRKRHEK